MTGPKANARSRALSNSATEPLSLCGIFPPWLGGARSMVVSAGLVADRGLGCARPDGERAASRVGGREPHREPDRRPSRHWERETGETATLNFAASNVLVAPDRRGRAGRPLHQRRYRADGAAGRQTRSSIARFGRSRCCRTSSSSSRRSTARCRHPRLAVWPTRASVGVALGDPAARPGRHLRATVAGAHRSVAGVSRRKSCPRCQRARRTGRRRSGQCRRGRRVSHRRCRRPRARARRVRRPAPTRARGSPIPSAIVAASRQRRARRGRCSRGCAATTRRGIFKAAGFGVPARATAPVTGELLDVIGLTVPSGWRRRS